MTSTLSPSLTAPLLLATDGSASARMAQKLLYPMAQLLAREEQESLEAVLHVLTIQPRSRSKPSDQPVLPPEESSPSKTGTNGHGPVPTPLTTSLELDFPTNLPISLQVRQGRPAPEILTYARTVGAGLVAVGQRGQGGMRELLLGSVSSVVARYAPCSVLVARGADRPAPGWKHVLLAVNESGATQQAIAMTRQLVAIGIEKITLLYVQPPLTTHYLFGPFATQTPSWQLNQSLQQVQKEQSNQLIHQAETVFRSFSLQVQTLIQVGDPGPTICQIAQQQQVDVVILGNRPTRRLVSANRRPVLRRIHLSVTGDYAIHHAPCPVLLCRVTT